MAQVKTTYQEGDLIQGRNITGGGDLKIEGHGHIKKDLRVDGWLDAPNIKGVQKGWFKDEAALKEAYPLPRPGWWAIVGKNPGVRYIFEDGEWRNTGDSFENIIIDGGDCGCEEGGSGTGGGTGTECGCSDMIGKANGIAPLDGEGNIPANRIPLKYKEYLLYDGKLTNVEAGNVLPNSAPAGNRKIYYCKNLKRFVVQTVSEGGFGTGQYYAGMGDKDWGETTPTGMKPREDALYRDRSSGALEYWDAEKEELKSFVETGGGCVCKEQKGQPGGIAELDDEGKIPETIVPQRFSNYFEIDATDGNVAKEEIVANSAPGKVEVIYNVPTKTFVGREVSQSGWGSGLSKYYAGWAGSALWGENSPEGVRPREGVLYYNKKEGVLYRWDSGEEALVCAAMAGVRTYNGNKISADVNGFLLTGFGDVIFVENEYGGAKLTMNSSGEFMQEYATVRTSAKDASRRMDAVAHFNLNNMLDADDPYDAFPSAEQLGSVPKEYRKPGVVMSILFSENGKRVWKDYRWKMNMWDLDDEGADWVNAANWEEVTGAGSAGAALNSHTIKFDRNPDAGEDEEDGNVAPDWIVGYTAALDALARDVKAEKPCMVYFSIPVQVGFDEYYMSVKVDWSMKEGRTYLFGTEVFGQVYQLSLNVDNPKEYQIEVSNDGLLERVDSLEKRSEIKIVEAQGSELSPEVNTLYRFTAPVETLAVTLPEIEDKALAHTLSLYFTAGDNPMLTISAEGGEEVQYQAGFGIEPGKSYEVNAMWNGETWGVASLELEAE